MKKIYYIETNGYDMLVSVDDEKNCRYMVENNEVEFPHGIDDEEERKNKILEFLKSVEDDSSWRDDCSYEDIFSYCNRGDGQTVIPDGCDAAEMYKILGEIEVEWE